MQEEQNSIYPIKSSGNSLGLLMVENKIPYGFRGRDAPAQGFTPDGSSLSDQAAVFRIAEFRNRAAWMASTH